MADIPLEKSHPTDELPSSGTDSRSVWQEPLSEMAISQTTNTFLPKIPWKKPVERFCRACHRTTVSYYVRGSGDREALECSVCHNIIYPDSPVSHHI